MALAALAAALPAFRAAADSSVPAEVAAAYQQLPRLKLLLLDVPSEAAGSADTPASPEEAALCSEGWDYAVLLSAAAGDAPAFERHVAHARRWARALAAAGAPPPAAAAARRALVEGLHLMQLLADGRLGDFYAAAEALPPGAGAAPAVALPLRLAGLLAGGAYGRVLAERAALPPALGALRPALDRLTETTVRSAAADAAGAAYERLPLADALAMLALPSAAALEAFVRERGLGWEIGADERGGAVVRMPRAGVGAAGGGGGRARTAVDPAATVAAALRWTAELDRIL